MNSKISEKEWLEDFQDFVRAEGSSVTYETSKVILERIHKELNPSPWIIFLKLLIAHGVVGTLSLAICDQFGMSPFQTNFSLSEYMMKFGYSACMTFCGFLFIGLTVALVRRFLRPEEYRVLRSNAPLQIFGLSTLSLVAFFAFGAEIVFTVGLLWFIGAMVGGITLTLLPRLQNSHIN